MDILVIVQVWAIVLFLLGVFALNTCSRLERKEQEFLKDPRNRYGKRKSDIVKPKTIDELRVNTNPQVTYSEPVQSGKHIDKRQAQSELFKHRPEQIRSITSTDDLLKTTGAYTKPKAKEIFNNKATNRAISKEVVGLKTELEKIREQVQNVE